MGFVGFLRFSLLWFIDFLAWPGFALVYPLWASIQAIETSSKYHMKKLVTYWTIFSVISLFEIFFVKLIEWVPLWPYIKLIAFCWLVIPQFEGACHVYQRLIHPCLSVNPRVITNWFSVPKEKPYSEDPFLASAEMYLNENGPEALEKLIANKAKCKEQSLRNANDLEVTKRMEPTEKYVTAEEQLVEHPKLFLVESENKEVATPEAQRVTTPAESQEKRPLEIPALKKVQREWTCALCQLTTQSEATLNSHLLGEKHRSKCEKLKASAQTTKNMQSSAVKDKSNSEELKASRQRSNDLKTSATKANDTSQTKKKPEICRTGEGSKQNTREKPKSMHIDAASGQQGKPKKMNAPVKQQPKYWCSICNIKCSGEIDMASHLKGRNHLLNMQMISSVGSGQANGQQMHEKLKKMTNPPVKQQPKFWCSICNISCPGKIDLACHRRGRKHLLNMQMIKSVASGQA